MGVHPKAEDELDSGDFLLLRAMIEHAEPRMSRRQLLELADYLLGVLNIRVERCRSDLSDSDRLSELRSFMAERD